MRTTSTSSDRLTHEETMDGAGAGYLCWIGSLERAKLGLVKGDITAAITWFTEKTGHPPAVLRVHPKCAPLAAEVPAGIEVVYCCGVLAWEAQLSLVKNPAPTARVTLTSAIGARATETPGAVSNDAPRNMSTLAVRKVEVDIFRPLVPTGRPRRGPRAKALPVHLVTQWAADGIGSKAIATKLKEERGIEVSYKTIQRVISGERPLFN